MGGLCAWPRGSSQAFGIEAPRICVRSSFLPPRHAPRGPRVTGERPPHEAEPFRRSPGWRAPARPSSGKATRRGPRVRFRVSWGPPLKRGKWRAARVPAHSTGWACGRGLPRSVLSPPAQRSPRHRPPFPQCPTPAVGAAAACPMPGPTRRCRGRAQGRGALAPPAGGREPPPEPAFCPWQRWLRPPQRCTGVGSSVQALPVPACFQAQCPGLLMPWWQPGAGRGDRNARRTDPAQRRGRGAPCSLGLEEGARAPALGTKSAEVGGPGPERGVAGVAARFRPVGARPRHRRCSGPADSDPDGGLRWDCSERCSSRAACPARPHGPSPGPT